MKVILLQDVARVGRRHEIKDVSDGLAQNLLIPRKMVLPATPQNIEKAKHVLEQRAASREGKVDIFRKTLAALATANLTLSASANPNGGLFKGVRAEDLAQLVTKEVGPLSADHIKLEQPIKNTGVHTVSVEGNGQRGTFSITIVPA